MQHVRHGVDYSDPMVTERQRQLLRDAVMKYKDHPALLVWNLGNEMESFPPQGTDLSLLWKEINYLAGMIKEMDPNHPVMTTIADVSDENLKNIREYYPNLDILGVDSYSSRFRGSALAKERL